MVLIDLVNKNKNKIFGLGIIILSLFIAFNIYKAQLAKVDSLKSMIIEESKKNNILSGIGQLAEEVDYYRKLLVKTELSLLMSDISNLAWESGVKIISIKPSGESTLPEYTKYNFELLVTSPNYDNLAGFINKVEVDKNVYIVDALSINSASYNKDRELKAGLRISAVAILD